MGYSCPVLWLIVRVQSSPSTLTSRVHDADLLIGSSIDKVVSFTD